MPPAPDTLSPLERALVDALTSMHSEVVTELRTFRRQTLGLVIFLVAIVALLKGVDPGAAGRVAATIMAPGVP